MEWLSDLAGFGASVASGGIVGLLGSVVGAGSKWLERREARKEREADRAHEITLHRLNMEAGDRETENEIRLAQTAGSYAGLLASHEGDAAMAAHVSRWVNDVKALFRPLLTVAAVILLWLVFDRVTTDDEAVIWFGGEMAARAAMIQYVVNAIAFTATLAVTWWFGDRSLAPPKYKHL